MDSTDGLLARAAACGFQILLTDGSPSLVPKKKNTKCPPKLMADLKAGRAELVKRLVEMAKDFEERCSVCRATWFESPTAELARLFCDRAATPGKAYTDVNGVKHERSAGCPFKTEQH